MDTPLAPKVDVRPADKRYKTDIGWLDSKHSFSFGQPLPPRQHPPRAAAGQQRRHRRARHRIRDPPAPRHGDRHLGAAGLAGAPGLHRPLRGDLSRAGAADERRHRHPALGEERLLAAVRRARHADPVHFVQMWVVPDEDGIAPGYEQLEIDDELLSGGLVPVASGMAKHDGAAAIRIKNKHAALHAARLQPGQTVDPARRAVRAPVRRPRHRDPRRRRPRSAPVTPSASPPPAGRRVTATEPAEILVWEMHATVG